MIEKTIEGKLVLVVKEHGGIAPKFSSPGTDGMPDRFVLLPGKALKEKDVTQSALIDAVKADLKIYDNPSEILKEV